LAVGAVVVEPGTEEKVAVLAVRCVVHVVAVFRIYVEEGKTGHALLQRGELHEKRDGRVE